MVPKRGKMITVRGVEIPKGIPDAGCARMPLRESSASQPGIKYTHAHTVHVHTESVNKVQQGYGQLEPG